MKNLQFYEFDSQVGIKNFLFINPRNTVQWQKVISVISTEIFG